MQVVRVVLVVLEVAKKALVTMPPPTVRLMLMATMLMQWLD
jgi:hypothetical protein